MKIIHLISDISRINYGVWNVVVATFPFLIEQGHEPEIWFPSGGAPVPDEIKRFKFREIVSTEVGGQRSEDGKWKMEARSSKQEAGGSKLEAGSSKMEARSSKQEAGGSKGETGSWKLEDGKHARDKSIQEFQSSIPDPQSSILVSHGNWGWATKTGYKMKRAGYKWIAVPHGMLEPWSLRQKWLKKKLYFHLSEYPKLKKADAIIAVGRPEFNNLKKYFDKVYHIPNGIVPVETMNNPGEEEMGRWGEGDMRRRGEGEMGKRGEEGKGKWGEEEKGRRREGERRQGVKESIGQRDDGTKDQWIDESTGQGVDESMVEHSKVSGNSMVQPSTRPPFRPATFTFLGRLHHKKGVVPLVKAWLASSLYNDERFQLIIAGPDEGELGRINSLLCENVNSTIINQKRFQDRGQKSEVRGQKSEIGSQRSEVGGQILNVHQEKLIFPEFNDSENPTSDIRHPTSNIIIKGPVYGKDKVELILDTTYFILPSQSEGFPTSILEAMTHGCIPVFTEGCNFPEALEAGVGIEIKYDEYDIRRKLEEISVWTVDKQNEISRKTKKFADENYNWKSIVSQQIKLYTEITGF